jgi:hypothetical protein
MPKKEENAKVTTEKQVEKGISDLVGCLNDPILVFPGGWGDSLPEWLKTAITLERLEMNMRALKGEEPTATDAEACAYLMTVSLTQPMDSDWTQIYLYIASKTYARWGKHEMPADIRVDSLNDCQSGELKRFKGWLYQKRTQARLDREQGEQRQKKEVAEAKRKAEQPALFEF